MRFGSGIVAMVCVFLLAVEQDAGAVHKGAGPLVCGSCHTMHNSQGGSSASPDNLGGTAGGSIVLLRGDVTSRSQIHKLCLECHASNGSLATVKHPPQDVEAPKVWSTATWTEDDPFNLIGAGGNFSPELNASWDATTPNALGYGHSLGVENAYPPGGDQPVSYLTCTNCHDPHGTSSLDDANINLFRNLRVNALDAGANSGVKMGDSSSSGTQRNLSYVGGVNGTYFGDNEKDRAGNTIWPVYRGTLTHNPGYGPGTDQPNSNAYAGKALSGTNKTMSDWCAQCHDNWHEDIATTNKNAYSCPEYSVTCRDWRRHPVRTVIPRRSGRGCGGSCHPSYLDRINYNIDLIKAGKGLPVTMPQSYTWPPEIPWFVYYLAWETPCDETTNCMDYSAENVFCLTCHFAHGGPYYDALRWNYLSGVSTGGQTPNGVPSNRGCQLCHNR